MRAQLKSTQTVSANRSNGTAQRVKRLRQEIEELMAVYDPYSPKFRRESVSLTHLRRELKEAEQQAEFEEFQETTKEKFQEMTKNAIGFSSKTFEKQRNDLTEFVRQASRVHR
jgi:predicted DNA binding protein